jgi:hypothetical protein
VVGTIRRAVRDTDNQLGIEQPFGAPGGRALPGFR